MASDFEVSRPQGNGFLKCPGLRIWDFAFSCPMVSDFGSFRPPGYRTLPFSFGISGLRVSDFVIFRSRGIGI